MSADPYLPPQALVGDCDVPSDAAAAEKISLSEFEAFTGKCSYPPKLKRYLDRETWHAGFNYWAAIFGVNWFIFRRLYLSALVAISAELGVPWLLGFLIGYFRLLDQSSTTFVVIITFIVARVVIGTFANIALAWKAEEVIRKVDSLNLDNSSHLKTIAHEGRVSVFALLIAYVGLGLLRAFSGTL